MTKKERILVHALINISKRYGMCWDGQRLCHDPQQVAHAALLKTFPKLEKELDKMQFDTVKVFKNGKVRVKGLKERI